MRRYAWAQRLKNIPDKVCVLQEWPAGSLMLLYGGIVTCQALCQSLVLTLPYMLSQDALQELAYASSRGGGHVVNGVPHSSGRRAAKFTFTQGTGGGGGKRNSTRRSAGDGNRRRS